MPSSFMIYEELAGKISIICIMRGQDVHAPFVPSSGPAHIMMLCLHSTLVCLPYVFCFTNL